MQDITLDEIYNSSLAQLEKQRKQEKTTIVFEFENFSFNVEYSFQDKKYSNPLHLFFNIFSAIKVNNYANVICLKFRRCTFKYFSIEIPSNSTHVSISFDKCEIGQLSVTHITGNDTLVLNDTKIRTCQFMHNRVQGVFHCTTSLFENLYCNGIAFSNPVSFDRCAFGEGAGSNQNIDFSQAVFNGRLSFEGSTFFLAPSFFGAQLHTDVEFRNCSFIDTSSPFAWRAYRTLKQFMMHNESDHEAQMFHALELESRYHTELPKGWSAALASSNGVEAIASSILKQLTDYGRNLWLPLVWLFFLGVLFLILYATFGGVGCISASETLIQGWIKSVCEGPTELFYAVRNTFGPFGLALSDDKIIVPNSVSVKALGFTHLLLSSVIWFIWILQIRSRFKL